MGGHPLPLHLTGQGVREVGEHGVLLGAFADIRWQDSSLRLQQGETLVAYTDGFTDAREEGGERFGFRRLHDTLAGLGPAPAGETIEEMTRALDAFQGKAHADDTAAIVLHRLRDDR